MLFNKVIEVLTEDDIKDGIYKRESDITYKVLKSVAGATVSMALVKGVLVVTPIIDKFVFGVIDSVKAVRSPNIVRMGSNINLSYLGLGVVKGSVLIMGAWCLILLLLLPVVVGGIHNGKSVGELAFEVICVIAPLILWGLF